MTAKLHAIDGSGQRANEVTADLAEEIKALIYSYADKGILTASAVGVLAIVQAEIIAEAE